MTSDDVVPRILAAIEETERDARAATQGPWRHTPEKHWRKPGTAWCEEAVFAGPAGADAVCVAGTGNSDDPQSMADAVHIARHDPDAVLRRCTADRRLLDLHAQVPTHEGSTETGCKLCLWEYSWGCDVQEGICETVQILADFYGVAPAEETPGE